MSFGREMQRAERRAQRPWHFRGPLGGGMLGGGAANIGPAPIIPLITQAQGCQLAFDSDYSPGATDGNPITALTNRSGSNAVFDPVNTWGTTTQPLPIWAKTGWGRAQSCLVMQQKAFRFTGSDITGCVTGVGKAFSMALIYLPTFLAGATFISAGWANSAGAGFANGMTSWCTGYYTPGTVRQMLWQGKAAANVPDIVQFNGQPLMFEMIRSDATHIQSGYNNVLSTPVAYGNGTNFDADGFYAGAWPSSTQAEMLSQMFVRAGFAWNRLLTGPERATFVNYVRTYYLGFTQFAAMGAS